VLPGDAPVAFTVGLASPAVVISEGVFADASRWCAVLAHERAHAADRDPLVRWLAEALTAFHLPPLGARLVAALREAQELAADEQAAVATGCRVEVAEALVDWMRWSHAAREAGVGFHSGPFAARVRRLLDPAPSRPGPSVRGLLLSGVTFGAALAVAAPSLHHAVETAFGLLFS
jgi:beta-lactamase regulating signal transducer with metallopeptidase domain